MRFRWALIALLIGMIAIGARFALRPQTHAAPASPQTIRSSIPQDAYVWQRNWNLPVRQAIGKLSPNFHRLVVLAAEISPRAGDWQTTIVPVDYAALSKTNRDIGLAIRIGPLPVAQALAMSTDSPQTRIICATAQNSVASAKKAGCNVAELQIDFDCAESKLTGYPNWVKAMKSEISPVSVVITTLPSWLKDQAFADLVHSADSYVLR